MLSLALSKVGLVPGDGHLPTGSQLPPQPRVPTLGPPLLRNVTPPGKALSRDQGLPSCPGSPGPSANGVLSSQQCFSCICSLAGCPMACL